jgi:hypothetical protein
MENKLELDICKKFSSIIIEKYLSFADPREIGKLVCILVKTLNLSRYDIVKFICETKSGDPIILSRLTEDGIELSTNDLLTIIKNETDSHELFLKSLIEICNHRLIDISKISSIKLVKNYIFI